MRKDDFYKSKKWRELRYVALVTLGRRCACCNSTKKELHVDHIKPRSLYPDLELDLSNLQILCKDCNMGKSNIFFDDFRDREGALSSHKDIGPVYIYNSESVKKPAHLWLDQKALCKTRIRVKNIRISKSLGHKNRSVCKVCVNIFNNPRK